VSVGRDTSYSLAAALAPVVFALVVTPFYLHLIGPDRFGVLAICWTLVGALGFASLGMGPAVMYGLASTDQSTPRGRSNIVWMGLLLSLAASLLGALLVLAIAHVYFQQVAAVPHELRTEMWAAAPYVALLLPIGALTGVLNGALQGSRRFGVLSAIGIISAALGTTVPLLTAMLIDVRLPSLVLAMLAANALVVLIQSTACTSIVPLRSPQWTTASAKALLNYGAWMSATALVSPFLLLFDRFLLGILRGPAAVAVYALAYNVLQGVMYLPASLSSAMLPRLAQIEREEDVDELQSSWLLWLAGILTPGVIAGIALSPPFFRLWIGPVLGSAATPVAVILLLGCWLHGIGHIASTVAVGRNRPDLLTKLLLACLVPYLVLLYFTTAHFGAVGAASAWTIRAAFDLILFRYTKPRRADLRSILLSGFLVVFAMVAGLALPWTEPLYWTAMASLLAVACYRHRLVLISTLSKARTAVLEAR
jgi:O-antigen/teichoic acid export membrane protein